MKINSIVLTLTAIVMALGTTNIAIAAPPTAAEIAAAQVEVNDAADALRTAEAALDTAKRALTSAQVDLSRTPTDTTKAAAVDTAKDAVDVATRELQKAKDDVDYYQRALNRLKGVSTPSASSSAARPPAPPASNQIANEAKAQAQTALDTANAAKQTSTKTAQRLKRLTAEILGGDVPDGTNNDGTPRTARIVGAIPELEARIDEVAKFDVTKLTKDQILKLSARLRFEGGIAGYNDVYDANGKAKFASVSQVEQLGARMDSAEARIEATRRLLEQAPGLFNSKLRKAAKNLE